MMHSSSHNWFEKLKDIDRKSPIEAITFNGRIFDNLWQVKEHFDYWFEDTSPHSNGIAFTVWTKKRVYFPCGHNGGWWMGSAPRHICDESVQPVGIY